MNYLSVCSGIEAATVAWHGLGWEPVGFSEIEPFPSAVLAHHYPNVPNLGDMTKYKEWNIGAIDLVVGGTPCQSFSVAGLRKGLEDPRGNLALVYCGILDYFKPRWFVWENVPGVLSSNGGRDFGSFLGAVAELGYGFAYRVLDAQYFGVAQRRRRVFVVEHLGDWEPAAKVLFEPESLRGNPAPSREKGKEVAGRVTHGLGVGGECARALTAAHTATGRLDPHEATFVSQMEPVGIPEVMSTLLSSNIEKLISIHHHCIGRAPEAGPQGKEYLTDGTAYCMDSRGQPQAVAQPIPLNSMNCFRSPEADPSTGCGVGEEGEAMFTISKTNHHAVAQPVNIYGGNKRPDRPEGGFYVRMDEETSKTLDAASGLNPTCSQGGTAVMQPMSGCLTPELPQRVRVHGVDGTSPTLSAEHGRGHGVPTIMSQTMAVRRLTPKECERLQGFPDNYTEIPWRGKTETPDGPRYKALGNSMAVPVMRWIGERIGVFK